MYLQFFNFKKEPFSIAPDPRFLYMSEQHKEALAHLLYGIQSSGAFVVLSGEVGSGKTTVCRCFLEQIPENVDVAFLLNPKLSSEELLASICDEFSIGYDKQLRSKELIDAINRFLLENHAKGRNTLVIIEEAQNLSFDVLEQLRLLTNLETNEKKLLQIVLLAQPEFLDILRQDNMKQLAQRITARFHLNALDKTECEQYIQHRLRIAGAQFDPFNKAAKRLIYKESKGVPRVINLICDRALLGAYAGNQMQVDKKIVAAALKELRGFNRHKKNHALLVLGAFILLLISLLWFLAEQNLMQTLVKNNSEVKTGKHLMENTSAFLVLDNEQLVTQQGSFESALTVLLELWYISMDFQEKSLITHENFCQFAQALELECLESRANIGTLLKLGSPAILKLFTAYGESYYGVLLGQTGQYLILQFGDETRELSFSELENLWLGEYQLLWKPPADYQGGMIALGDQGPLVLWLNERLQQYAPGQGEFSETYTQEQQMLVESLQKQAGIYADGVVGVQTFIYLSTLFDSEVPRLSGGVFDNAFYAGVE